MVLKKTNPVTVIVPVYGDWPSLKVCIESLQSTLDHAVDNVLLVNDCGPEVELLEKNIKQAIDGYDNFTYARNKKNLGFVQTCNRAVLDLDTSKKDIMLLNSDAALIDGTMLELKQLLADEKKVGAVSPRSNNATICTIPIHSINQRGIVRRQAHRLFQKYHTLYPRFTEVPTAHGFCMLIRRSVIEKQGLFDEKFGRGYGEEVDFCQRMRAAGWKTVVANWAFAYHLEARSFSMKRKMELLAINGKVLKERYPDFSAQVRDTIADMKKQEWELFSPADKALTKALIASVKARKKLYALTHNE